MEDSETPKVIASSRRLILREATTEDDAFILALINQPAWHQYIARHSITTHSQAKKYIQTRLVDSYRNNGVGLWVVETKLERIPIGLCGFVKRPYLNGFDLGFALLPDYCGQGYAGEASRACLDYAKGQPAFAKVLAITLPNNHGSIKLLEKLGFCYTSNFSHGETNEVVSLYEYENS